MAKADVCDIVGGLHCWGRQNAVVSKKRIKWRKDTEGSRLMLLLGPGKKSH